MALDKAREGTVARAQRRESILQESRIPRERPVRATSKQKVRIG